MSEKDFMRGVETAAKASEAFMRKQAAASEELGKRIVQKIDEQGKIIDVILDTLNAQEKKELYDLQSAYDIADLGENEKEVLASFLLTLISKYSQDNDNQKDYYFAVKKHLGVTDVSPDFDLSLVENVDSRSELKAMLQTVCEFLFLKTGDTSFLDEFEDEIGYFGLSRKVIREIVEPIERIYDVLGLRGIVEHYIPAEPEVEEVPEHYGLISPIIGEITINDTNRDIPTGTESIFENLRVVITKQFKVKGKVVFRNCQIVLAWNGNIALNLMEEASEAEFIDCEFVSQCTSKVAQISICGKCIMRDCKFDGVAYRYGVHDDVFQYDDGSARDYNCGLIDVDGYEDTAELILDHCYFVNCEGTVVSADGNQFGNNFKISVNNCLIENHIGNFLMARYADGGNDTSVEITNSTFQNISSYENAKMNLGCAHTDWDFTSKHFPQLVHVADVTFRCEDNTFLDINEDVLAANNNSLGTHISKIIRCTFVKFKQSVELVGEISDCTFDDAKRITFGNCGEFLNHEVVITACNFTHICGHVAVLYGRISHCIFTDSTVTVEVKGKTIGKDPYISEAANIKFINCTALTNTGYDFMDTPCFLQATSYLGKPGFAAIFKGCKFENCQSSGKYINTDKKEFGAFSRVKILSIGKEYGTTIK